VLDLLESVGSVLRTSVGVSNEGFEGAGILPWMMIDAMLKSRLEILVGCSMTLSRTKRAIRVLSLEMSITVET